MKRIIAAALAILFTLSMECIPDEIGVPREHWKFMPGYRYDYSGCRVGWSERQSGFIVSGDQCNRISSQKMTADAIKSIEYVKRNSSASDFLEYYTLVNQAESHYTQIDANADAQKIWLAGCSDFKNGMNAGDFREWLKLGDTTKTYPRIKKIAVTKLYMDGWDTARGLGGIISCGDLAPYRASAYVSGVDIRQLD
ncbi:hypothetical protein KS461_10635 [Pseudomonas chlororaphis]|uniref:hypothetical protein n=1 Tax=Pseudomonas chlororaphis TaxID=587753 RepID=UPI00215A2778|nr:hypothetical protein [Pseudomonas chlororaphis]UVE47703.1 hypothetical protein KS461_10635 [Pseudomonas chlororaphis]